MRNRYTVGAVVAVLALLLVMGLVLKAPAVDAAPAPAPTPVASVIASPGAGVPLVWLQNTVLTANNDSAALSVLDFDKVDLQLVVDVGTVNTTTLKLQFSNDNVNWVDGATVGTAIAADANTMAQYAVFGQYARINSALTNSSAITITAIGIGK